MNNNLTDRGIIKWQPFNSCFDSNSIIKDIKSSKERMLFPILSDDQIYIIEEKIIESFNLKLYIIVEYYYDGNIKKIKGKINYLNLQDKKLYINNISIYFKQILKITEL